MVNTVIISSNRIPAAFSGFRIAQVSDLHNAEFGENNAGLLKLLSESKPDIIVMTGGLVDASHTDIGIALGIAQESVKIAPTYFVTGNHEVASPQYDILKAGLECSCTVKKQTTENKRQTASNTLFRTKEIKDHNADYYEIPLIHNFFIVLF